MEDKKLVDFLDTLSQKLNTTSTELFAVLVKQAKIDFFIAAIQLGVLSVLIIPVKLYWNYLAPLCVPINPSGTYSWDKDWPTVVQIQVALLGMATLFLGIGILVLSFELIEKGLKNMLNPKAVALEKILRKS